MSEAAVQTAPERRRAFESLSSSLRAPAVKAAIAALGLGLLVLYVPTLRWLAGIWWNDKEYSHGFLVPLISAYLIWIRREHLQRLPLKPDHLIGGTLLGIAALGLAAGRAGGFPLAEGISLLLFIPATLALLFGTALVRTLALPIAYLQFMVPWMDNILERLYYPFQLISADIAVFLLNLMGYSVLHQGKYIYMPNLAMEVARECSGIRFLTTIVAIGLPLVYLSQKNWKRGIAVLTIGCVLAILTNGVRVAIAGVLGTSYGAGMLHGPAHIFQGWFVAQVGLVLLFVVNALFSRLPNPQNETISSRFNIQSANHREPWAPRKAFAGFVAATLVLGIYVNFLATPRPVKAAAPLSAATIFVGEWRGADSHWLDPQSLFPGASEHVVRTYKNAKGELVHVYIGRFDVQTRDRYLVNFRARDLHGNRRVTQIGGKDVEAATALIADQEYAAVNWFYAADRQVANRYAARLYSVSDALLRRRSDASVVVIAAPIEKDESAARERVRRFAEAAMPEFDRVLR